MKKKRKQVDEEMRNNKIHLDLPRRNNSEA